MDNLTQPGHRQESESEATAISKTYEKQTNETLYTHSSTKNVNIPVVASKYRVEKT